MGVGTKRLNPSYEWVVGNRCRMGGAQRDTHRFDEPSPFTDVVPINIARTCPIDRVSPKFHEPVYDVYGQSRTAETYHVLPD